MSKTFLHTYANFCALLKFSPILEVITCEEYITQDYVLSNRASVARSSPTALVKLWHAPTRNVVKKAFVERTIPRSQFLDKFTAMAPMVFNHHQLERNQREVHLMTLTHIFFGMLVIQMDFAENIKLIVRQQRWSLVCFFHFFDFFVVYQAIHIISVGNQLCVLCACSQIDYFQTQQVALLVMCATYLHPQTRERINATFAFLSDDCSHSSVSSVNGCWT